LVALTAAIQGLRDLAARVTRNAAPPGVRKRCALYSLDQGYVQTLEPRWQRLAELARKATDAAAVARKKIQVERSLGCARPLVEQLVQAFENASRLDKSIPLLRAHAVDLKRSPN